MYGKGRSVEEERRPVYSLKFDWNSVRSYLTSLYTKLPREQHSPDEIKRKLRRT